MWAVKGEITGKPYHTGSSHAAMTRWINTNYRPKDSNFRDRQHASRQQSFPEPMSIKHVTNAHDIRVIRFQLEWAEMEEASHGGRN